MTSAAAGSPVVHGYHAHVHDDAGTLPLAEKLRQTLAAGSPVELGRFSGEPVGPYPQLDLFAGSGFPPARPVPAAAKQPGLSPADLNDAALLAAIPASGRADGPPLAAEAGRRRLGAAVPVLEDYCRRFAGFGMQHALPEQVATLAALAAVGGQEAARSVARILGRGRVQGPTLRSAVADAA